MAIHTYVIWAPNAPTAEQDSELKSIASQMEATGELVPYSTVVTNIPEGTKVSREWTTTSGAEEWVSIVLALNPPPISAEVVTS